MKKIILGVFLLMSVLSFAAGRKVPIEKMMVDDTTGITYVQGEKTPFTGTVEVKYDDGEVLALMEVKNGLMEGTYKLLYPSGKTAIIATYKNGKTDGIQKEYYENG